MESVACGVGVASLGRSSADRNQRENDEANNSGSDNRDDGGNSRRQPADATGAGRFQMGDMFAVVHGFVQMVDIFNITK